MNIIALDGFAMNPGDLSWSPIEALGSLTIYDRTPSEEIVSRAKHADIIITNKVKLTSERLSQLPNLKLVVISATGYDNVNVDACKELGISVSNIAGYSSESVTQHVFSVLLSHLSNAAKYEKDVANGRWTACDDFTFFDHPISALNQKKIGIIGLGNIGQQVLKVFLAFGCEVYTWNKSSNRIDGVHYMPWHELLATVDVLTLHLPLNEDTEHMINTEALSKMKADAILINTARGGHIQESELAQHLQENPQFTALIDVLSQEPPSDGNPLIGLPNCHITPHQAWAGFAARSMLMNLMVDAIHSYNETGKGSLA